jgi:hypothetical protein
MLDISASGVALLAPRDAIDEIENVEATVDLGELSFTTRLGLVRLGATDSSEVRVGGRFRPLARNAQRDLSRFLVDGFLAQNRLLTRLESDATPSLSWHEPRQIESILRMHALRRDQRLRAHAAGATQPAFHFRMLGILCEGDARSLIAEVLDAAPVSRDTAYTVVIADGGSIHHFRTSMIGQDGRLLRLAFPIELKETGFRDSHRAALSKTSAKIRFDERVRIISDVGARGFSFEVHEDAALVPGHHLDGFLLDLSGQTVEAAGIVRSVAHAGSGYACGVEILAFADRTDAKRWNHFVFHETHPRVTLDATRAVRAAWSLLDASDYLSGWTSAAHQEHLAREFDRDWTAMSEDDGHILLLNDETRAIGTVAGNRIHAKTWMVHHLGIDRDERTASKRQQFFDASRELYSAIMYMVQHVAETDYFAIWVEQSKRWNEMLYGDFVRAYSDGEGSLLTTNMVYKLHVEKAVVETSSTEVGPASADELASFSDHLVRSLSPIEVDAFGYGPADIARASGHQRARAVYVARVDGEVVAALIAESGGEGANVFGLFNMCRIIAVRGALSSEVRRALLLAATDHYRTLGKLQFIFIDDTQPSYRDGPPRPHPSEADAEDEILALGFERVSPGVRWIVKRDAVPGWLSFVERTFRIQNHRKEKSHDQRRVQPQLPSLERERVLGAGADRANAG